jgi:hypothetical protein
MTKIVGSGSISQRHGSAEPDPSKNVTDPQHCLSRKTNLRMEMCEGPDHEGAQFTAHQKKRTLLRGRKCDQAVQVRHHAHCAEQIT